MKNLDRLKFRIWDKKKEKWSEDNFNDGEGLVASGWYIDLEGGFEIGHNVAIEDSRFIVEQSTGIYDIDGNLIFEGDIIGTLGADPVEYVVKWNESTCSFYAHHTNDKMDNFNTLITLQWIKVLQISILGNIHQEKFPKSNYIV